MEVDFFEILSKKTPRKHAFPVFLNILEKVENIDIVFLLNILGKVEKIYVGNFEKKSDQTRLFVPNKILPTAGYLEHWLYFLIGFDTNCDPIWNTDFLIGDSREHCNGQ